MSTSHLAQLEHAGRVAQVKGDRPPPHGPAGAVTPALVERVRAHKAEVLEALTPRMDAPLRHEPVRLTHDQVERLCRLMDAEPLRGFGWVLGAAGRADLYEQDRAWSPRDCDTTAAVDWLLMRRGLDHRDDDNVRRLLEGTP